jgi:hypothetical protein
MELSSSWEANSHSASQEIPRLLWNPNVYYRVYKSPPLVPTQSQMHPVHNFTPNFPKINSNILSSHLRLGLPHGLFPSGFTPKIVYAFLISPMRFTCPAHLMLFDMSMNLCNKMYCFVIRFQPLLASPPETELYVPYRLLDSTLIMLFTTPTATIWESG